MHGTGAQGTHVSNETKRIYQNVFSDNKGREFSWSGGNNHNARLEGAGKLAGTINEIRRNNPNEPINVIAHSHGGNVALQALKYGAEIDNLVTLGTPVRKEYIPQLLDNKPSKSWTNVYSPQDQVQNHGGGSISIKGEEIGPAGREFGGANNVPVISDKGPVETHSVLRHELGAKIVQNVFNENKEKDQ